MENINPPILYGTAYYPDHWPETDWEHDLFRIQETGIRVVRFGEFSWSWFEPHPGEFNFRDYDRFMHLVEKAGLGVMLCTPTCNPPPWFFARHPDARMVDQHGRMHIGHRHMTCYNHPAARELAERAVRKLAERYRDHPALVGWQIDNEPNAGENVTIDRQYDYNPYTLKKYHQFLETRYSSLEKLNELWTNNFWGSRFSDLEEIDPPRPGLNGPTNPAAWMEWSCFREQDIADHIHEQAAWLRSVCRDFKVGTNIPDVKPIASISLGQNYWLQSAGLDFVGLTHYNYCGDPVVEENGLAYSLDVMRGAAQAGGARFGVLELQGGPHLLPWQMDFAGGLWEPDFLRRSIETCVAHQAEFIYLFLWRGVRGGAEFGMNSLAEMDGSPSTRTCALQEIISSGETRSNVLSGLPCAYLHYSQDSIRLSAHFDPNPTADRSIPGWHALLEDLGYRVEVISSLQQLPTNRPAGSLLALPYSLVLRDTDNQALASDNHLVLAGFATGFFDEYARIRLRAPGDELSRVLGVQYTGFEARYPLLAEGLPIKDQPLLQTRAKINTASVRAVDDSNRPLLVLRGNVAWLAFDLGSLYLSASLPEREQIVAWIKGNLPFDIGAKPLLSIDQRDTNG